VVMRNILYESFLLKILVYPFTINQIEQSNRTSRIQAKIKNTNLYSPPTNYFFSSFRSFYSSQKHKIHKNQIKQAKQINEDQSQRESIQVRR
jgi:hypothetical protein